MIQRIIKNHVRREQTHARAVARLQAQLVVLERKLTDRQQASPSRAGCLEEIGNRLSIYFPAGVKPYVTGPYGLGTTYSLYFRKRSRILGSLEFWWSDEGLQVLTTGIVTEYPVGAVISALGRGHYMAASLTPAEFVELARTGKIQKKTK